MKKFLVVLLAVSLSTCSGISATVVSGEVFISAKETFKAAGAFFYEKCNPDLPTYNVKMVPTPVCQSWADFAKRFKASYEAAYTIWDATAVIDPASHSSSETILSTLVADLMSFVTQIATLKSAYAALPADGGQ